MESNPINGGEGEEVHLIVPHSVEEARQYIGETPQNRRDIRSLVSPDDQAFLARAIFEYMRTKNIAEPTSSWQDFWLNQVLSRWEIDSEVAKNVDGGETRELARLHYLYPIRKSLLSW
jgi:hypothetical protein